MRLFAVMALWQSALGVGGQVALDSSFGLAKWTTTDASILAVAPDGNGAKAIARSPGTATIVASGDAEAAIELRVAELEAVRLEQDDQLDIRIVGGAAFHYSIVGE